MKKNLKNILRLTALITTLLAIFAYRFIAQTSDEEEAVTHDAGVKSSKAISESHKSSQSQLIPSGAPTLKMPQRHDATPPSIAPLPIAVPPANEAPKALSREEIAKQNQAGTPPQVLSTPPSNSAPVLLR